MTYDDVLSDKTVRDYVCARCWGHLIRKPAPGRTWTVECAKDPEHGGYVTKYWVERQRGNDAANLMDANQMLRQIGVVENPHKGKTSDWLLKEMGF